MLSKLTGAALLALALACAACGNDSRSPSAAPQAGDRPHVPDESKAAAGKPQGGGGIATDPEKFLPALRAAHADVTWPTGYAMSVDRIWQTMSTASREVVLTEVDAKQSVSIWNICAWTLQLIDDAKQSKDVAPATEQLEERSASEPGMRGIIDQMVSGARLGDLATAEQFVEANGCARGFE